MKNVPVESGLIGTVIEHLQELTSPQMEHELRVDAEVIGQAERRRILLPIICELLAQADEHSIQPP
jgi:hypothetical protein